MKKVIWILGALALLLLVGAGPPDDGPRNVRLRAQVVNDSISFDLRWVAPQRGARQTPITGYEWEFWISPDPGSPFGTLAANGANAESDRQVVQLLPFSCATPSTYYTARVRATGNFSAPGDWGVSGSVEIVCDNSPPGPPVVDLDTIQAEDPSTPADSTVLMPISLAPPVTYDPVTDQLDFPALHARASLCALAYRDGVSSVPERGGWTLEPIARYDASGLVPSPVTVAPNPQHPDLACWDLWSQEVGGVHGFSLCNQLDCRPVLAGIAIPKLPYWMKVPLAFFAGLFIGWSLRPGRKADP